MEAVIHLPCQEDIHALFQMTPYYWKTPRSGAQRLAALTALDVTHQLRYPRFPAGNVTNRS